MMVFCTPVWSLRELDAWRPPSRAALLRNCCTSTIRPTSHMPISSGTRNKETTANSTAATPRRPVVEALLHIGYIIGRVLQQSSARATETRVVRGAGVSVPVPSGAAQSGREGPRRHRRDGGRPGNGSRAARRVVLL